MLGRSKYLIDVLYPEVLIKEKFHLCNKVNNETVCESSSIQLYQIPEIKKNRHLKLGQ